MFLINAEEARAKAKEADLIAGILSKPNAEDLIRFLRITNKLIKHEADKGGVELVRDCDSLVLSGLEEAMQLIIQVLEIYGYSVQLIRNEKTNEISRLHIHW